MVQNGPKLTQNDLFWIFFWFYDNQGYKSYNLRANKFFVHYPFKCKVSVCQACVIAFSTVDRPSLVAVRKWRKKVEEECGDIPMVMVQNKIDLISQSEINQ